jgi:hypothetical protein
MDKIIGTELVLGCTVFGQDDCRQCIFLSLLLLSTGNFAHLSAFKENNTLPTIKHGEAQYCGVALLPLVLGALNVCKTS